MKDKKETINKIILGILTFILIIYISSSLIFLSMFNISKKFLNKNNVSEFISNINITDILKDELGNELNEFTLIKEDLNDIGITSEGINEFINSEDVKEFSGDVITNIFDKISNNSNIDYKITNEEVTKLFEDNIDKLNISSNISQTQILNKVKDKIPNLVLNINELIDNFCDKLENSEMFQKYESYIFKSIDILDVVYSDLVLFIIIFIIVSFITLLIFIRRSLYKSLKWLSISFIIPSVLFGIISTLIFSFVNVNNVLVTNMLNIVNRDLINHSLMYFVITFIFVIINVIWYIIKKYKKKKVLYE